MRKIVYSCLFLLSAFSGFSQIQLENTLLTERTVVDNLDVPWDMTYSNDGWIWFTELSGNIRRVNPDTNQMQLIHTVTDVEVFGFSAGMHSIVLHPDFPTTPQLFVHYLNSTSTSKIVRYDYDDNTNTLINPFIVLNAIPGGVSHNGSRMLILNDKLYISIGDGYSNPNSAQDTNTLTGNILRLNLDGSIPSDNPIPNSYIWSFGHRNPQGLCYGNGKIYSSEHGTAVDDEINIIEENRNYGWPNVEGYCNTASEQTFCNANNVKEPIWTWTPAIAPCGMDYFNHPSIPEWENSLLLAVLKDKQLIQLQLNADGTVISEENAYLTNVHGRLRDVLVIPDGRIFICTTNKDFIGNPNPNDDKIIEYENEAFLSVSENEIVALEIFPNPSDGTFSVRVPFDDYSDVSLEILNLNGQLISNKIISNPLTQIETSTLDAGIYFLRLKSLNGVVTKKLVIR